jgi:hypothetical protein
VLTHVLQAIQRSYAGSKSNKIPTGHEAANLYDEENGTRVRVMRRGRAVVFDGGTLTEDTGSSQPRYFAFGQPRFHIQDQIDIAKSIVGNDVTLPKTARDRRQQGWRKWFDGEKDDGGYGRFDIPAIIQEYSHCWDNGGIDAPEPPLQLNRRHLQVDILEAIEVDLRMVLVSFGLATPRCRRCLPSVLKIGDSIQDENAAADDADGNGRSRSPEETCTPPLRPGSRVGSGRPTHTPYPQPLLLASLRCCTEAGRIDWDKADELAGLEYLLYLLNDKDFVASAVPAEMEREGVAMPMTMSVEEMSAMSPRLQATAKQLVGRAREDLVISMGPYYQPKDDEMLYQWLRDGR